MSITVVEISGQKVLVRALRTGHNRSRLVGLTNANDFEVYWFLLIHRPARESLSQGLANGTNTTGMDVTPDLQAAAFPASSRYEGHTQPSDHLMAQEFLELDEYFVVSEEAICSKLREYEERLIKQFINNMSKADQKSALVESLNKTGWTWKSAEEATRTICLAELAEQKQREAEEEARRIAADEAATQAQQPRQRANIQRRKRKKKNW